jgi:hypothetical protein
MREKEYILFTPDKRRDIWGQRYWRAGFLLIFVFSVCFIGWFYFVNLPEAIIYSPNVPNMPLASDNFDCDDSALFMYEYFTSKGYECTIVVGNLEIENETFLECKHIWVMVTSPDKKDLAYDWGIPQFDKQHYHGYELTPAQLKEIVLSDILALEKSSK